MNGYIYKGKKEFLEDTENKEKFEKIRREILANFMDAENLNFLIGTGASRYLGAEAINSNGKKEYLCFFDEFNCSKTKKSIRERIDSIKDLRIEKLLDELYLLKNYLDRFDRHSTSKKNIDKLIGNIRDSFLNQCVLYIYYSKTSLHKLFIKKVLSRKSNLSCPNIFTLNYDMAFEIAAEDLNVMVNNGFIGFQKRSFFPFSLKVGSYYNIKSNEKRYDKAFNLFKLHGSLSWEFDSQSAPYGIVEKQFDLKNSKIELGTLPERLIIYPIQSKKRQSLDLPYSELIRQFIESVYKSKSVLIVIGYSFSDEHINDIITNALSNPDFNLVVFSYESINDLEESSYLHQLAEHSLTDNRITLIYGEALSDFKVIVEKLMPYVEEFSPYEEAFKTFLELKNDNPMVSSKSDANNDEI